MAHGQAYRILADARGSVRLVVDAGTGQVMQALRYSPWGRVMGDTDPGFQPFGYAGGLYDRRTGLERFGVRDYDPGTGRWIEPDPILFAGGGTNLYAYTDDDPVDEVDPSGLLTVPFLDVWIPAGETQGAYAARYWANASQDSGNTWIETAFDDFMGGLASLWTPCTSNATATVLGSGLGVGQYFGRPFWRYVGPESNPESRWLTRGFGWKAPYGNDFSAATDALQLPHMPNNVESVDVPWYQPVIGPRQALDNPQFGPGGGLEYYRSWSFPRP